MKELKMFTGRVVDWCYDCAEKACKNGKQKMFAWIAIQLLRQLPQNYQFYTNSKRPSDTCFVLRVFEFYENSAIEKYIERKRYWNFVLAVMKKQFVEWGITDVVSYKTSIQFYKDSSDKVEYIEFWFHPRKELY